MSYQVLARKWRPAKFAELVGQEHVKSALINGLTNQRLHHAYLFTGTRGVGKTSIARIFAKSLNCETGITAEPCGQCATCVDVDAGRFVDLIEIDAASRTKVGDTREILDNVQYAPTRGRYKIYLIDEVHMLSRHSFNALLKTLEEPPEHVKFLLATTDPQKLPVTILSRCLQFNLQALDIGQIDQQLQSILQAEQIQYEASALTLIAKYAHGSMRDGLSLTDQAIAQSGENLTLSIVQSMLGTVDIAWSQNVFTAILTGNGERLIEVFSRLEKQRPDFIKVLDDMLTLCHQIAMAQVLPAAAKLSVENEAFVLKVAQNIPAAQIQVYYQLLLQGKKDLPLAPEITRGFEMLCLRLLAFKPVDAANVTAGEQPQVDSPENLKKNLESSLGELLTQPLPDESSSLAVSEQSLTSLTSIPQSSDHAIQQPLDTPELSPQIVSSVESQVESKIEQNIAPQELAANQQSPFDNEQGNDVQSMPTNKTQEVGQQPTQANTQAATQPNTDSALTGFEDYQHISDQTAEQEHELLSQQAFYQDMAESQGFEPSLEPQQGDVNYSEQSLMDSEVPSQAPSEIAQAPQPNSALSSTSELENPVMAILANRGLPTNLANVASSVQTAAIEKLENNIPEAGSQPTQIEHPVEKVIDEKLEELPDLKPIEHDEVKFAHEVDEWARMIEMSDLAGLGRQLARNGEVKIDGNQIELTVKQEFAHLLNERSEAELTEVVSRLSPASNFVINKSDITQASPADIQKNINVNRQERAEQSIAEDGFVQTLINEFGGKILPGTINPVS